MLVTTLEKIRKHKPCKNGWAKLLASLGKIQPDDDPLPFLTILNSNGLDDALWCCRTAPEHDREWRLFTVWCARQVEHLMTDKRSINAICIAERYANGKATKHELSSARNAAWSAAWHAAKHAACASEWSSAWAAAHSVMWPGEGSAVKNAAWNATYALAEPATWEATWNAIRDDQKAEFLRIIS